MWKTLKLFVHASADLAQSIPDLAIWIQCFSMYPSPARLRDLMAYQAMISKASLKFKWPSWIMYDLNFRQEVAGTPRQAWAQASIRNVFWASP